MFRVPPTSLALAYRVWESCGVETPGFCDSLLSLSGATMTTSALIGCCKTLNGAIPTVYLMQWYSILMAIVVMISVFDLGIVQIGNHY